MDGLLACPTFTDVRFEVLTLVRTMMFFQVVTPCTFVGRYHHLGETYCFHIQGSSHGLYLRVYMASQPRTSSSLMYDSLFTAANKRHRAYKACTTVSYNVLCNNIIIRQNFKIRSFLVSVPLFCNFISPSTLKSPTDTHLFHHDTPQLLNGLSSCIRLPFF
jgi:hypothetical protein